VAGGVLLTGQAAQASPLNSLQADWAWCSLCDELFFAGPGFRGQGVCPKQPGDGHASPSGVSYRYSMVYSQATTPGLPGTPGYQAGWRFCAYCYSLYYAGSDSNGDCPSAQGEHGGNSYNYAMPVGLSGPAYQGGWNYCKACSCLYHAGGWGAAGPFCWVNYNRFGGSASHSPGGSWPYVLVH
jgi:hypothetical protein